MNEIREFLVSGGKRGAIEYVRINRFTGKAFIDSFGYTEFIYDALSDTKVAEALRLLTSGEIGIPTYIDALVDYAQYYYGDEVEHFRNEREEK